MCFRTEKHTLAVDKSSPVVVKHTLAFVNQFVWCCELRNVKDFDVLPTSLLKMKKEEELESMLINIQTQNIFQVKDHGLLSVI